MMGRYGRLGLLRRPGREDRASSSRAWSDATIACGETADREFGGGAWFPLPAL
jgi:hypothetical protein